MADQETTFTKSTLDANTGQKKDDPNTTLGTVVGDYYSLDCAVRKIESAISAALGGGTETKITPVVSTLPNVVLDANDESVTSFLFSNYGITITEGTYGPDNLLRLVDLSQYDELKPLTYPSGYSNPAEQGEINKKALLSANVSKIIIPFSSLETLVDESIAWYSNIIVNSISLPDDSRERALDNLGGLYEELMQDIHDSCHYKKATLDHLYGDNIIIQADASAGVSDNPLTYYNADSMVRRRPHADFFTVEMIAPPTDGSSQPTRVDLQAAEGRVITSLKLNMSPSSLVVNAAKKTNRYQTLVRWVEEHWGDEMDQVSFSGSTFSFLDFKTDSAGLCVDSRNMTEPYRELRHLVDLYKQNGIVYQPLEITDSTQKRTFFNMGDPANPYTVGTHPRAGMAKYRLYIRLRCYFAEFIGYFESFDVAESSDKAFSLNYSVSFRAEHTKWL